MFTEKATQEDIVRLSRYEFQNRGLLPEVLDIAEMLIEDESGYELGNQCDDAENFVNSNGETFFQRVCTIFAVCRLLADEDKLRFAVKHFFVEQATDGSGVEDEEAVKKFVERMCDAVIRSKFLTDLVLYVRQMYLYRPANTSSDKARKMKHRMRVLRGFKADSELCRRNIDNLAPPPPLKVIFEEDAEDVDESKTDYYGKSTEKLIEKYDNYDYTLGIENEREKLLWGKILNN